MRRLPVYILLDCSESMVGDAINSVQSGLATLLTSLRSDPHALETAWVSIITFSQEAEQIVPLQEITEIQTPRLIPRPGTALGKAFSLLQNCIEAEVKRSSPGQKADYRPLVFLLTDGQPTDDWRTVRQAVSDFANPRIANLYAIGCGDDIDFDMLNEVADGVFKIADMNPNTLKKLFIWLTASVQSASQAIGGGEDYAGIDISKKPPEISPIGKGAHQRHTGPPLQVFLKAMCINENLPYLMRFRLNCETQMYVPVQSHKLEPETKGKQLFDVPQINASMLEGVPGCPHCPNSTVGVCGCGGVMCLPELPPTSVVCPNCENRISWSDRGGQDFTIQQSAG